ncbi:uncharacterized protein LOC128682958 [Plodia interpunctella]|uniref:uncharacterized protein LOC128682958 n=1 Tax=Plodia interpunctella TaxID=58824 RepID=UPI00236830BC|nr:uncharacterized protein LOC128682958 [Plodia interpunctella]
MPHFDFIHMDEMLNAMEPKERTLMLVLRLVTLAAIIALIVMHARSMRVFRWEQSVSGGILVTYTICMLGLCLCAGTSDCGGEAFQAFICGTGAALFAINAGMLWRRWRKAGELTRIVAELLVTLGLQLKWQLRCKIGISAVIAALLLLDMAMNPLIPQNKLIEELRTSGNFY